MEQLGEGQAITVAFTLDKKSYALLELCVKDLDTTKSKFLRALTIDALNEYDKKRVEEQK